MAPRKQTWDQVRKAGIIKNKLHLQAMPSHSAYAKILDRNLEGTLAGAKRQHEEEVAVMANDSPKAKLLAKFKKPAPTRVNRTRKAAKPKRRARKVVPDDEDENEDEVKRVERETEAWRPYGGGVPHENNKSNCLGIARISAWQTDMFREALESILAPYGTHTIEYHDVKVGGEELTDVWVLFPSIDTAEFLKKEMANETIRDRALQVSYEDLDC